MGLRRHGAQAAGLSRSGPDLTFTLIPFTITRITSDAARRTDPPFPAGFPFLEAYSSRQG